MALRSATRRKINDCLRSGCSSLCRLPQPPRSDESRNRRQRHGRRPGSAHDVNAAAHADGEKENLPAIAESYVIPQDATKAEREALRAEFFADNQAVEKLLEEKGFVMTDQAHASAQVSRYFKTHPDA